ncbi:hypothetical protein Belba_0622 [Belliella baltica DSM 15883]|uniref:Uncharacterized protein n=1 Tax=Belliella baltica (strain DSM 15883 / CIP 108006 / LMG 21964 / BA134) TaxID=866536 RepID=I3Z209_BELBD|nr:hypothetical protein Belba_0622 [Belliella baltica DSM 15883]
MIDFFFKLLFTTQTVSNDDLNASRQICPSKYDLAFQILDEALPVYDPNAQTY